MFEYDVCYDIMNDVDEMMIDDMIYVKHVEKKISFLSL